MPGFENEQGGDAACWAHLFADELFATDAHHDAPRAEVVDLARLAREASAQGVAWSCQSDDFNANLLVFGNGDGVEPHVNDEVDVLIVAMAGEGIIEVDGEHRPLHAGQALVVPKGARRAIHSASDPFAYLTCHRRRAGLWPASRS